VTVRKLRSLDAAAIGLFMLLFAATYGDVLFRGAGFFQRDLTTYHYPMKKVVREMILEGHFPLWNPYYGAGQPMAANPAWEIFYPPQLLVLLPGFNWGYQFHILVHLLIGGLGLFALTRSLGASPAAALLAAIAFSFGGPLLSLIRLLPFLFSMAWVPWILLFARRFLLRPNGVDLFCGALFLGVQATVGEPTTLLQTWTLISVYALFRIWSERRAGRPIRTTIIAAVVLLVAGAAVGAVQLVPAADHAGDSVRSEPFTFQLASDWSMPWKRPVEMLFPAVFRQLPGSDGQVGFMSMYPMGDPFIGDLYIGLLPILLVIAAAVVRPKQTLPIALVLAGCYLVAVGKNTPLFALLYKAGIFESIRYPEKFILSALVLLAIVVAVMGERLVARDKKTTSIVFALAILWTLLAALLALTGSSSKGTDPTSTLDMVVMGEKAFSQRGYWLMQLVRGAVLVAMLAWLRKSKVRAEIWTAVAASLLVADLSYLQRQMAQRQPARYFERPDIAQQLPKGNGYRLFHYADVEWADATAVSDQFFGEGRLQPWMIRNGIFPRTPAAWGIPLALEEDFDQTHLLPTAEFLKAMREVRQRGASDWKEIFEAMAGVQYRATFRSFEAENARVAGRLEEMVPIDIEQVAANPRYYFASQLTKIRDRQDFVFHLTERGWNRDAAFVEFEPFAPAPGRVISVTESSPTRIRIEAESSGQSFLVISMTPHKYWRALLDGKETALHVANVGLQGIVFPAGRHTVELRYSNPRIAAGAAIMIVALIALIAAAVFWKQPVAGSR
jgi:hypothetical protein